VTLTRTSKSSRCQPAPVQPATRGAWARRPARGRPADFGAAHGRPVGCFPPECGGGRIDLTASRRAERLQSARFARVRETRWSTKNGKLCPFATRCNSLLVARWGPLGTSRTTPCVREEKLRIRTKVRLRCRPGRSGRYRGTGQATQGRSRQ
jgi:hypothetical protein